VDVDDSETVRACRVRALLDAPEAFSSTYEREVAFPRTLWVERLGQASNATFLCDADGDSCGIATIVREGDDSQIGWLVGMWVAPSARGTGAADLLVTAVLLWSAEACLETVRLHVTAGNDRAERM
jgi:hypothetical protein